MLRKSPTTNAWAARNWVYFSIFSYLKFFFEWVLSSLVNMEKSKDGNVELYRFFVVINKLEARVNILEIDIYC